MWGGRGHRRVTWSSPARHARETSPLPLHHLVLSLRTLTSHGLRVTGNRARCHPNIRTRPKVQKPPTGCFYTRDPKAFLVRIPYLPAHVPKFLPKCTQQTHSEVQGCCTYPSWGSAEARLTTVYAFCVSEASRPICCSRKAYGHQLHLCSL